MGWRCKSGARVASTIRPQDACWWVARPNMQRCCDTGPLGAKRHQSTFSRPTKRNTAHSISAVGMNARLPSKQSCYAVLSTKCLGYALPSGTEPARHRRAIVRMTRAYIELQSCLSLLRLSLAACLRPPCRGSTHVVVALASPGSRLHDNLPVHAKRTVRVAEVVEGARVVESDASRRSIVDLHASHDSLAGPSSDALAQVVKLAQLELRGRWQDEGGGAQC